MASTHSPSRLRLVLGSIAAILVLCGLVLGWLPPFQLHWSLLPTSFLLGGALFAIVAIVPSPWHMRLGTSLFAFLFILLLLELLLAFVAPPMTFSTIYELDPICHYRLIPGSSRYYQHSDENGGGRILVRVNSQGYRGAELPPKGDTTRIAVFGDSFIAAEFSEEDATFVARLARHTAELLGRDVEAVNVGVAGYGPDQVAVRLRDDLLAIDPDIAVLGVYSGNDFGDLVRNQLFRIDPQGNLEQSESNISEPVRREFWAARYQPRTLKMLQRSLGLIWDSVEWKLHSWFGLRLASGGESVDFVEQSLEQTRSQYNAHVEKGDRVARNLLGDPYDADVAAEPRSASAQYKRALMKLVLERVQEIARSVGVPIVLVIIPSPIDTCDDYRLGSVDPARHPDYDRKNLTRALAGAATELGMPFVDLFGVFREHPEGNLFLRGYENHWNDEGQDLAAKEVSRYLVTNGLLKK